MLRVVLARAALGKTLAARRRPSSSSPLPRCEHAPKARAKSMVAPASPWLGAANPVPPRSDPASPQPNLAPHRRIQPGAHSRHDRGRREAAAGDGASSGG